MGPEETLDKLCAEYANDSSRPEDCVEFVFHTYYGFVVAGIQNEHRFRLPPNRARELLWKFHKFNLTWGLLCYAAFFIPILSTGNYWAQKRSIGKQERALAEKRHGQ